MSWDIDAIHSHVGFSVRHMMVSTVRGRFNVLRGQLHIDENDPANSWVEAEVDVASVNTQNEQRDGHLRTGDFFEADKYPTITFKSTKVVHVEDQEYKVTGDLTMHGVTKSIIFNAEYNGQSTMAGLRAGLTAKTKISRKDFGMVFGLATETGQVANNFLANLATEASQVAISDTVTIEVDLEVTAKAAEAETSTTAQ